MLSLSLLGLATLFRRLREPWAGRQPGGQPRVALAAMWPSPSSRRRPMMRFRFRLHHRFFLVAVALFGDVVNARGAGCTLGVTRFQPSEMMKLALRSCSRGYFHRKVIDG